MACLLDTNIAIHLRDRDDAIVARFRELAEPPSISIVTRVELEGGVYAHPDDSDQRREAVDLLLQILPAIDFDAKMAAAYGRIVAHAGFSRRKVIDRMIAATAIVRDLTLITANAPDFSDIDGLKLEVWNL